MGPKSGSVLRTISTIFSFMLLLAYQNCGVKGSSSSSSVVEGVRISCSPSDKPCLPYKISVANLRQMSGEEKVSFQLSGGSAITAPTLFSANCQRTNSTTAYCPFGQTATGSIENFAMTQDGRVDMKLTVSFFAEREMKNVTGSTLTRNTTGSSTPSGGSKLSSEEQASVDEEMCFDGSHQEFRDGDFVPFSVFRNCQ